MSMKAIPAGSHSVTPYLIVTSARRVLDFLREAFGAQARTCMEELDGKAVHAAALAGGSKIMLAGAQAEFTRTSSGIHLYAENVNATFDRALKAAASLVRPVTTRSCGGRSGIVRDAWGNWWNVSTHVEGMPPDEMAPRAAAAHGQC